MRLYLITFKPKKYKGCCILKILDENKHLFNIFIESIGATNIEKITTIYITLNKKPKKYDFLLLTDIIRDLLPLESSLSFKLVERFEYLLFND